MAVRSGIRKVALLATLLYVAACAAAPTPVAVSAEGGFALYRSGQLSARELGELCRLGLDEIVVLDGGGGERECALRERVCPSLRVRYDTAQDARRPLTGEFLAAFDAWIQEARAADRKIAFRCRHGWHRAGRLTAWYRMRFEGAGVEEAVAEMLGVGRFMGRHPQLVPQVRAMADLLAGRPCSTAPEQCVVEPQRYRSGGVFAADVCP